MAEQKLAIKKEEAPVVKKFMTRHNGDFNAGGIEFKKGVVVELTKEQQEIPAIKNSIGTMLEIV